MVCTCCSCITQQQIHANVKKARRLRVVVGAEKEHEKFLKKMGIETRGSVGSEQRSSKPWVTGSVLSSGSKRSVAQSGSVGLGPEGQRFKSSL